MKKVVFNPNNPRLIEAIENIQNARKKSPEDRTDAEAYQLVTAFSCSLIDCFTIEDVQ